MRNVFTLAPAPLPMLQAARAERAARAWSDVATAWSARRCYADAAFARIKAREARRAVQGGYDISYLLMAANRAVRNAR